MTERYKSRKYKKLIIFKKLGDTENISTKQKIIANRT